MNQDILAAVQLFSILLGAFGAPGLTFWVMKRLSRETLVHIKDNCDACRARLDEKIERLEGAVHIITDRQIKLRETLPTEYVRRDEFNRHLSDAAALLRRKG